MKRTNFFIGIFLAFFSPKFYREVAKDWRGRTFLALLTFLALISIVVAIFLTWHIVSVGRVVSKEVAQQLPVITVKSGLASTAETKPTFIYLTGDKVPFIIVDTHSKASSAELSQAVILVKQNEVMVKHNKDYKTFKFNEDQNTVFGPMQLQKITDKVLFFLLPVCAGVLAILMLPISYLLVLFFSLLFGLFEWLLAIIMSRETNYWGAYHMTVMAWVPAITFSVIVSFLAVSSWLLLLLFLVIYVLFGALVLPRKEG